MKKNIYVTGSIVAGLVTLGTLVLVSVLKSNEKRDDRKKTSMEKSSHDTKENAKSTPQKEIIKSVAEDVINLPEGIIEQDYDSPKQLFKDVLFYLLQKSEYTDPGKLLEVAIRLCSKKIEDYSWYEEFPKNVLELEEFIDESGYHEVFQRSIANSIR